MQDILNLSLIQILYEKRRIKAFECEYIKELKFNEDAYIKYDELNNNYAIYNFFDELSFIIHIEWSI